jgi:hypothetical protein
MHENHKLAIPEQKTDAEIALAIHYLDPEFNDERTGEDAATILRICVTFLTWLTDALMYICLSMRTLENANAAGRFSEGLENFLMDENHEQSGHHKRRDNDCDPLHRPTCSDDATVIGICVSPLVVLTGALVGIVCFDLLMALLHIRLHLQTS